MTLSSAMTLLLLVTLALLGVVAGVFWMINPPRR